MTNSNYLTQQAMRPTMRPQTNPYVNPAGQFYPQSQMNGSSPHQAPAYEQQYGPGPQYPPQTNMQVCNFHCIS